VTFNRLAPISGTITFNLNQAQILPSQTKLLDRIGQIVQQNPTLQIELQSGQTPSEIETIAQDRSLAIQNYLQTKWQIKPVDVTSRDDRRYPIESNIEITPAVQLKTIVKSSENTLKSSSFSTVKDR
jgi:hypothetical protein